MRAGVDFTLEDLLCALDGQISHRIAQLLLGALHFLCGFCLGLSDNARLLGLGILLGLLDQRVRLLLGICQTALVLRA